MLWFLRSYNLNRFLFDLSEPFVYLNLNLIDFVLILKWVVSLLLQLYCKVFKSVDLNDLLLQLRWWNVYDLRLQIGGLDWVWRFSIVEFELALTTYVELIPALVVVESSFLQNLLTEVQKLCFFGWHESIFKRLSQLSDRFHTLAKRFCDRHRDFFYDWIGEVR